MISPLEVYRAKRTWHVGWFVAWTRLRARREYWKSRSTPSAGFPHLVDPSRSLAPRH